MTFEEQQIILKEIMAVNLVLRMAKNETTIEKKDVVINTVITRLEILAARIR